MTGVDGWALVLALARVAPLVIVAPAVAGLALPRVAQAALAVAVAAVIAAGLGAPAAALADAGWAARAIVVGREALIGAVLGAIAAVPLAAASLAGAAVAAVAEDDGGTGAWPTLFGLTAAAVFFGLGGHLAMIGALGMSYDALPAGAMSAGAMSADVPGSAMSPDAAAGGGPRPGAGPSAGPSGGGLALIVGAGAQIFAAGLALAAPLLVAALLAALLVGGIERIAGLSSELVPELAVRRLVIALAAAAAVFAIGLAIAGHTRALPSALAAAVERMR